jgi:hypothetical protein
MHKRHASILTIVALLSIGLTATAAVSQTKPNTTSPAKKSSPVAAKTIPTIKCTDPGSMVACKSFRQLVEAQDKGLLRSLTGNVNVKSRHFAYVCLPPKDDIFKIIEFYEPQPDEYRPYSPPDVATNPPYQLIELQAFPDDEGKPEQQLLDTQKKWYEEHSDSFLYDFGDVSLDSWVDGIQTAYVHDWGKWRRHVAQRHSQLNEGVYFESAHQWLAQFNEANANQLSVVDGREHPRISVGDTGISVQYSFKNKNNDYTEYTLNIQRSTGRFTESFAATGLAPFEDSGTCMSFKY